MLPIRPEICKRNQAEKYRPFHIKLCYDTKSKIKIALINLAYLSTNLYDKIFLF